MKQEIWDIIKIGLDDELIKDLEQMVNGQHMATINMLFPLWQYLSVQDVESIKRLRAKPKIIK